MQCIVRPTTLAFLCLPYLVMSVGLVAMAAEYELSREKFEQFKKERTQSEEERAAEKEMERMRSDPKGWRTLVMGAQMFLGRFGYRTGPFDGRLDENTRRALREYQQYNGFSATGDLDFRTLKKLGEDNESLDREALFLPSHFFLGDPQFVTASGTWIIVNMEQAWPFQTARIHCHRKWRHCIESLAIVTAEGRKLDVELNYYEVERWDDHEIITKPRDLDCVRYTLRISYSQKQVTGVRSKINSTEPCSTVGAEDLRLRLEDGHKVWQEHNKRHQEAARRVIRFGDLKIEELR